MLDRPGVRQVTFNTWFRALALVVLMVGAWAGCRCRAAPPALMSRPEPSVRLVLVSGIAGAIEPCGCVKDMLGGVDHAAAYLKRHAGEHSLVLGAGPMLFMDPVPPPERTVQDRWKAEALVQALLQMEMRAWAPGANDFAVGAAELGSMVSKGPLLLAANLASNPAGTRPIALFVVGGIRVGVAGLARPEGGASLPPGVGTTPPLQELQRSAADLRKQGAHLRIALVSMPRSEALRLAELVPEFQVMLIGKAADEGEGNDPVTPPVRVGRTLVVESPNHLQAFHVVDLFVKNDGYEFENADAQNEERADLERRVRELEQRLTQARANPAVSKADLQTLEQSLRGLQERRKALSKPSGPPDGSHYRVSLVEVREELGADASVQRSLSEYYRRVNEHNKTAFKDRLPPPTAAGQSEYLGADTCMACHQEEHAFWSKTRHAKAYETLSKQHKEFNLDCVGCHVTGYEKPGGSTVTHVDSFKDVQCEVCHGPGSRHLENPADDKLIIAKPDRGLCGPECHHPPHVKPDWSVDEAWKSIIGPGHGG